MKIAVYPGSFDPITNGHIDVLKRALNVFDKVILLIAENNSKRCRFSLEDRLTMTKDAIKDLEGVTVDSTNGLTVEYAKKHNAKFLIRGLRAVTDFEYEFQLNAANNYVDPSIDVVFFMSHNETTFISSSAIDSMVKNNVDISALVPPSVVKMYKKR